MEKMMRIEWLWKFDNNSENNYESSGSNNRKKIKERKENWKLSAEE